MIVTNLTQNKKIGNRVRAANHFFERMRGLIGSRPLDEEEGLWIPKCQGVHTFGMTYPIDVLYLDEKKCVIGLSAGMPPRRLGPVHWRAASVLELAAGTIERIQIKMGDGLDFKN